jgi:Tfp pilus assembly protein PilW
MGFSLIELMISLGLGLLVLGATAVVALSHVRSTIIAERSQRVRDDGNRLNYLLQVEAGEAARIRQNVSVIEPGCPLAPNSLFTLDIPLSTGSAAQIVNNVISNTTSIHYYNKNSNFMRCGPPINRNGSLNTGLGAVEGVVSSGTALALVTCQGVTTDKRAVAYQATYSEAGAPGSGNAYQPPCEIARAKSFLIEDPLTP